MCIAYVVYYRINIVFFVGTTSYKCLLFSLWHGLHYIESVYSDHDRSSFHIWFWILLSMSQGRFFSSLTLECIVEARWQTVFQVAVGVHHFRMVVWSRIDYPTTTVLFIHVAAAIKQESAFSSLTALVVVAIAISSDDGEAYIEEEETDLVAGRSKPSLHTIR